MTKDQIKQLQTQLNAQGANLKVDGILGPLTTTAMNKSISAAVAAHPATASLVKQNGPDALVSAYTNGNWSGVHDVTGKPFSDEDQQAAVDKATAALSPAYDAQYNYDTATAEAALGDKGNDYQHFLNTEAADFGEKKTALDKNAADNGILFSGSRVQKERDLKNTFDENLNYKTNQVGNDIATLGRNYDYKYGSDNGAKLSQYYQLPGQSYNPGVARGGAKPAGSLSSVYSTTPGFQGTAVNTNKANIQTRAASLLANKGNKLVPYGYKNQF